MIAAFPRPPRGHVGVAVVADVGPAPVRPLVEPPSAPIYQQIARLLRSRIYHGLYQKGMLIPSENALSEEFGVTRLTIRQALNELRNAGALISRRGAGTYVDPNIRIEPPIMFSGYLEDLILQSLMLETRVRSVRWISASREVRAALALPSRARVLCVERTRFADGTAVQWGLNYLPETIAKQLEWERRDFVSLTELLARHGIVTTRALRTFDAITATQAVATMLGVRHGTALMYSDVTSFAADRPVNYSRVIYAPRRSPFTVALVSIARDAALRQRTIRRA